MTSSVSTLRVHSVVAGHLRISRGACSLRPCNLLNGVDYPRFAKYFCSRVFRAHVLHICTLKLLLVASSVPTTHS